jgi:hypothetical protein
MRKNDYDMQQPFGIDQETYDYHMSRFDEISVSDNNIEEILFDIITGNEASVAANVIANIIIANIINDIQSGENVIKSIEKNCE